MVLKSAARKQRRRRSYITKTLAQKPPERKFVSRGDFVAMQNLLSTLQQLSQNLVSEVSVEKILEEIMKTLGQALKAVWVNIWELTPDGKATVIRQGVGRPGTETYIEHSQKSPLKLGVAFIGRALKTKKTWTSSDMWKDPHLPRSWVKKVKEQNFRAIICTPQIVESAKVVGGMCVYFDQPRVLSDFELRLVAIAANQAAVAMVNAKIFQDLLTERDKTLSIIYSLNEGVILYDNEGKILLLNPKAEELLWVRAQEVTGKILTREIASQGAFLKNIYQISNLAQAEFETKEYTAEGLHKLVFEVILIPVYNAARRKIGSMRILRDITREKQVDLLKSGFISTASHQMRTPLTSIRWALDALDRAQAGPLTPPQKDLLKKALVSSGNLAELLNDLLNASRLEEGRFGYVFKDQDVFPLVKSMLEGASLALKQQKLNLVFNEPEAELPKVRIDRSQLAMAIQNILDNAIRYSSPGKTVTVELTAGIDNLVLSIKDEGIGIPPEDQKFIFVKFFRAKNAVLFQTEGSGLGLYIAKQVVENHNGRLVFESVENKGSTFSIFLPTNPKKMPSSIAKPA